MNGGMRNFGTNAINWCSINTVVTRTVAVTATMCSWSYGWKRGPRTHKTQAIAKTPTAVIHAGCRSKFKTWKSADAGFCNVPFFWGERLVFFTSRVLVSFPEFVVPWCSMTFFDPSAAGCRRFWHFGFWAGDPFDSDFGTPKFEWRTQNVQYIASTRFCCEHYKSCAHKCSEQNIAKLRSKLSCSLLTVERERQ